MSGKFKISQPASWVSKAFADFCKDRSGATAIEYGMIGAIVSIVLLGILLALGTTVREDIFGGISTAVVGALSGS
ncbi:Flp family type IVb pilin [Roseibium sp. M-1]